MSSTRWSTMVSRISHAVFFGLFKLRPQGFIILNLLFRIGDLRERLGFAPERTMFVDDSEPVLDAAARFGLGAVVAVTRPDTRRPVRAVTRHASVEAVAELLDPAL